MKKILAIIMSICMIATVLCVPAFAALLTELDAVPVGTVLRVTAIKDGDTVLIGDYYNFEDGWNAAMKLAGDEDEMKENGYERIVVDLHTDWKANKDGQFSDDWINGDGFKYDTIYIPDDAKVTLNMKGHTIDRGLTEDEANGEVMSIDEGADVIINNGTIKGGYSNTGAGGIHIFDNANVTLNDVHIVGNKSDMDDGGGIAVYDGAILTVNGGSFEKNMLSGTDMEGAYRHVYGAAVYVEDSTAIFNDVKFKDNYANNYECFGIAIYASDSNVEINECIFEGNAYKESGVGITTSTIHADDSTITVKGSTLIGNGVKYSRSSKGEYSAVFSLDNSKLIMTKGTKNNTVSNNATYFLINDIDDSTIYVSDTDFVDNKSAVLYGDNLTATDSYFRNCTFNNNVIEKFESFYDVNTTLTFYDCDMGDSTYSNKTRLKFETTGVTRDEAVIGVSTITGEDAPIFINYYKRFEDGWNAAMTLAIDMKNNKDVRIVVDLYTNWKSGGRWNSYTGNFGEGNGFKSEAIYVPEGVNVTLNMNGYTINRALKDDEDDGEVIYIDASADIIINGGSEGDAIARGDDADATFGTITGGNSYNGAGGIHINDNAMVVLNNVRIDGNRIEDDDGAGIAVYDGATLIMNGGSISNNNVDHSGAFYGESYGGLFVSDANAVLTDVLITDNGLRGLSSGAAIFIKNGGHMTMKNCYVLKNGYEGGPNNYSLAGSIICVVGSSSVLDITDSTFENNGSEKRVGGNDLIVVKDATLKINNSKFNNNYTANLINCDVALVEITKTSFEGNVGAVFECEGKAGSHFTECTFSENTSLENYVTFYFYEGNELDFKNCDLGNSTFNDRSRATFDGAAGVGSVFGKGSLTMIVALVALIASAAAIVVNVSSKKKAVPATANSTAETEDKEE